MKAYRLHGIADYKLENINKPIVASGEVLVKVKAAGICGSDIPRIYKTGAYHHPMTPGHEFSGQVEAVGEGVDSSWEGKRVGIFPLIPCMECSSCKKKLYEMCKHYNYLGSRTDGGFAEYVRVPEWNLIELPDNVSYEQAAMMEPMAVAVHSIRKSGLLGTDGKVVEGACEKLIAVCGLGTIGLFIVMFLKSIGIQNIYVGGNKAFQFEMADKLGVDKSNCCDIRKTNIVDWISENTNKEGVDVFFECVGKKEILDQGLNSTCAGGTLLLVGNPAGDMDVAKASYWKILRQQLTVQGTWNSSFTHDKNDDWNYVLNSLKNGMISPEKMITHKLSVDELINGFELMRDKTEDYVKVMGIF